MILRAVRANCGAKTWFGPFAAQELVVPNSGQEDGGSGQEDGAFVSLVWFLQLSCLEQQNKEDALLFDLFGWPSRCSFQPLRAYLHKSSDKAT